MTTLTRPPAADDRKRRSYPFRWLGCFVRGPVLDEAGGRGLSVGCSLVGVGHDRLGLGLRVVAASGLPLRKEFTHTIAGLLL